MKEETGESFDRMTKWMENSKSEILDRTRYMFTTGKIETSRYPYQFLIGTIYTDFICNITLYLLVVSIPYRDDLYGMEENCSRLQCLVSIPYRDDLYMRIHYGFLHLFLVSIPYRDDLYMRFMSFRLPSFTYQFLIGTIYTSASIDSCVSDVMYQFLIGTIYTRSVYAYTNRENPYQFLIGTIYTFGKVKVTLCPVVYQFLIGTIYTLPGGWAWPHPITYQFLIGTIYTMLPSVVLRTG